MNQAIINAINDLLPAYQSATGRDAQNLRYLIGQLIRQYHIPNGNWHISAAARDRWDALTTANIKGFHYRDVVICDKLTSSAVYELYKGANKTGTPTRLHRGAKFQFRQMFHEDHVIPVSLIIDELKNRPNPTQNDIQCILNGMHLCVILKEEDRRIGRTQNRTLNYQQTIANVYTPAYIDVC